MTPIPRERVLILSPNQGRRVAPIRRIVLHDTASHTAASALNWFARPDSKVSAHVVIDRDGAIYRCVPDSQVAWHARLHNADTLGVEMVDADNSPADPYPAVQLEAVALWCAWKCRTYGIPVENIVGHADVSVPPGRKIDPGPDFPWPQFRARVSQLLE